MMSHPVRHLMSNHRSGSANTAWLTAIKAAHTIVWAVNGRRCPMTSVAARFTDERSENFDIYLPVWLAKHNKQIFSALYVAGVAFAFWQWVRASE